MFILNLLNCQNLIKSFYNAYLLAYQYKQEIYGISKSKPRTQVKYDEMNGTQNDNISKKNCFFYTMKDKIKLYFNYDISKCLSMKKKTILYYV